MLQAEMDLLVIEAQMGNRKALECLVEYFYPKLLSFSRSLCASPAIAEDAVQETWITVTRRLKNLKDPRAFKSWLFKALRCRIIDIAKAGGKVAQNSSSLEQAVEDTLDGRIGDEIDQSELEIRSLNKAIEQLNETERSVIYLFYQIDMSIEQVSAVLEIPKGTVKSRLNRARKQLNELLDPRKE